MVDGCEQREGSDITAEHMVLPEEEPSEIAEFFSGSTVFITGATGFLGKVMLEKLLRTCAGVKRIYVLIRPKKGKEIEKRFEEMFEGPNFEPLKRLQPNFSRKVTFISGDLQCEDVGLSKEDKEKLISEVDCLVHCGATVKFDESIRVATNINVRSVRDLIMMARQMKNLRAFLYVSTAFSNCPHQNIDETFYDPPITGAKLLQLVDALDDDKLAAMTNVLLGEFPNSYVFTKAVAENVIKVEGKNLPISVFRPSIVIGAVKEPVAGWIDNVYGATGVLLGAAMGLIRTLHAKVDNIAEMVPADYVVNSAIASMWDVATIKSLNDNKESKEQQTSREEQFEKEIPVYNFVSSLEAPITWREYMRLSEKHCTQIPSPLLVWHYFFALHSSRIAHLLAIFFYHTIPSYIVDGILICMGKKPMLVKGYKKINKFCDVISYFAIRQWKFSNDNVQTLWKRMKPSDKKQFEFSMQNFDWDTYFYTYVRGGRVYILKDPLDTIPQGRVKYYKLMAAHYTLMALLGFLFYKLLAWMFACLF